MFGKTTNEIEDILTLMYTRILTTMTKAQEMKLARNIVCFGVNVKSSENTEDTDAMSNYNKLEETKPDKPVENISCVIEEKCRAGI